MLQKVRFNFKVNSDPKRLVLTAQVKKKTRKKGMYGFVELK